MFPVQCDAVRRERTGKHACIPEMHSENADVRGGSGIDFDIVRKDTFARLEVIIVQQLAVDAAVRFGDSGLAGSHAAVKQLPELAGGEKLQDVRGNIGQIIKRIPVRFQPLHQLNGILFGAEHIVPVVENDVHFVFAPDLGTFLTDDFICFITRQFSGVQTKPLFGAERNILEDVFQTLIQKVVDEKFTGRILHNDAAQIKNYITDQEGSPAILQTYILLYTILKGIERLVRRIYMKRG